MDVIAPVAALLHRLVDDETGRGRARHRLQAVGARRVPAQALDAVRARQLRHRLDAGAHALQRGQEAAAALARVGGAVDDGENPDRADGARQRR